MDTKTPKVLVHTCANSKYYDFIPLFASSILWSCQKDVCVCVGTSNVEVPDYIKNGIDTLNLKFGNKIVIMDNVFVEQNEYAAVNNTLMMYNTVRFITEPVIKAEYVYISDIDIAILTCDFYEALIFDMESNDRVYSNKVRISDWNPPRMTGLHFTKYDAYYPIDTQGVSLRMNDEQVLHELVKKKGIDIDYSTTYRPVFGPHMSLSRPSVAGDNGLPGWEAEKYKHLWNEYKKSEHYAAIKSAIGPILRTQIDKLEKFYAEMPD